MAAAGQLADLVIGNNVLAQVPDLNDFVAGIAHVLKPTGTVTIEFPHVMRMIEENQFDTIYHEHFCYFSLTSAEAIFAHHGMTIFDVEELWTHGGSLRIYARPASDTSRPVSARVTELREREEKAGYRDVATYARFEEQVRETKRACSNCSMDLKRQGASDRRLRRTRQGQHVAQLLRDPHRLRRLHRRSQSLQAGPLPARDTHPDPCAGTHRRGQARLHLDLCRGTSRPRSWSSSPPCVNGAPSSSFRSHAPGRRLTMLPIALAADRAGHWPFVCLGAHSDDIEIGCGGTILDCSTTAGHSCRLGRLLRRRRPGGRGALERRRFPSRCRRRPSSSSTASGRATFPYIGADLKDAFEMLKAQVDPDVVFTHCRDDDHQDHRTLAQLTWNTFRDHLIAEYEFPKYDGDLGHPNLFVPLRPGDRRAQGRAADSSTSVRNATGAGSVPRRSAG